MMREEVEQYTNLTGEDGWHVPIIKVGAYLDGYNKGLEVLDKIRAEIEYKQIVQLKGEDVSEWNKCIKEVLEVIDKYKVESEDKRTSETETWNGIHGQVTAPKGTFEKIYNECGTEDDDF